MTTTPGTPVPPDELMDHLYADAAKLGESVDEYVIAEHFAAWGYAQAIPEREELAGLLRSLSIHCDHYAASLQGQSPAYANWAQQTRDDAARARAAAERLGGGGSDG